MGMYSVMELSGKIKKGKEKELKEAVKKLLKQENAPDFVRYFLEDMKISNGYIEWDDYYQRWYYEDEFVKFIAPFLEPQDIIFYADDGIVWGYRIKKDGSVWELEMILIEKNKVI